MPKPNPFFAIAILLVGLAEFGWAAEILPRNALRFAGRARFVRWLCALLGTLLGTLLAVICLALNLTSVVWFGLVTADTGVLLSLEMALNGPANRP